MMKKQLSTLSTIAALLVGGHTTLANAQALDGPIEIPAGNGGLVNAGGMALKTGLGDCLQSGTFSDDDQVNACAGIEDDAAADADGAADAASDAGSAADAGSSASAATAPAQVTQEPIVTTATLGGEALFASGSAELGAASEQALAELVSELEKYQEITAIEVTGHTDSTGSAEYNQTLSEQRAAAVEAFIKAAYPNVNVNSSGQGESSPVATNSTSEGRAQNRRVEVRITAKSVTE